MIFFIGFLWKEKKDNKTNPQNKQKDPIMKAKPVQK